MSLLTSMIPSGEGNLVYKGTWNASTNTPTLASGAGSSGNYYVVSDAGSTNVDGVTDWGVGDWIIFNGSTWQKIDNDDISADWGNINGTLSSQTDLMNALNAKQLKFHEDTSNPTINDDASGGYEVGQVWVNTDNNEAFICFNNTNGAAVWVNITGTGGTVQNPGYTIPTIDLTYTVEGNQEVGSSVAQDLTVTGIKNDAGAFTSLTLKRGVTTVSTSSSLTPVSDTDMQSQFGYADPNNPNYSYSLNSTDNYTVTAGDTTWSGEGAYGAGTALKDSDGNTDTRTPAQRSFEAPQAADSAFGSNTVSINGIYPYFYGVSDTAVSSSDVASAIAAGSGTKVVADSSGTLAITFGNSTAKYLWFAHPATETTKTSWYINELNNGDIPGNLFASVATENVNSPDAYWSTISYKIYYTNYATVPGGTFEMRN